MQQSAVTSPTFEPLVGPTSRQYRIVPNKGRSQARGALVYTRSHINPKWRFVGWESSWRAVVDVQVALHIADIVEGEWED